jgi:hypothetical protein
MPRVENFALHAQREGGLPGLARTPAERRLHALRYLMACGHTSLPNRVVCERGCLVAPAYGTAFRGTKARPRGVS